MENEINLQDEIKMRLTPMAENYLMIAARWAKFVAILGFIGAGFLILTSLFIGSIMSIFAAANPAMASGAPAMLLSVFYLIMAGVYFLMALFMYNFATKTQRGLKMRDEYSVELGAKGLKNYFLTIGIMIIVMFSLMILGFFVGIIAGISNAF